MSTQCNRPTAASQTGPSPWKASAGVSGSARQTFTPPRLTTARPTVPAGGEPPRRTARPGHGPVPAARGRWPERAVGAGPSSSCGDAARPGGGAAVVLLPCGQDVVHVALRPAGQRGQRLGERAAQRRQLVVNPHRHGGGNPPGGYFLPPPAPGGLGGGLFAGPPCPPRPPRGTAA